MTETGTSSFKLTATIAAEVLLGKVRLNPRMGEPRYLYPLRHTVGQLKRVIGAKGIEILAQNALPALHVLADLLFDAVTGVTSAQTETGRKSLSIAHRVAIDRAAAHLTGKDDDRQRWNDELWAVKNHIYSLLATSDITAEEFREGFDDLVHNLVDELFKRRTLFIG